MKDYKPKPDVSKAAGVILAVLVGGAALVGILACGGLALFGARSTSTTIPMPAPMPAPVTKDLTSSGADVGGDESELANAEAAIASDPSNPDGYVQRSRLHQKQGNWQSAIEDVQQAVDLNPDDHATWTLMAMLRAACPDDAVRDGPTAVQCAQKACELSNWEDPQARIALAVAYAETGDWQAATDICDELIANHPEGPLAAQAAELLELFREETPYRLQASQED